MGQNSNIEWTDTTWNPILGCSMCSSGCANCYAQTMSKRLAAMAVADAKAGKDPGRKSHYLKVVGDNGKFNGVLEQVPEALTDPFSWKKPRRVFVNSMSDLFHANVPFAYIDRVFAVMALTPQHTYQILTKRPERMAEYFATFEDVEFYNGIAEIDGLDGGFRLGSAAGCLLDGEWSWGEGKRHVRKIHEFIADAHADPCGMPDFDEESDREDEYECKPVIWPLPNVHLGTSVENQAAADERIPHLLRVPAAVRFLSCEPLLGPIDLTCITDHSVADDGSGWAYKYWDALSGENWCDCRDCIHPVGAGEINWVIVGGESGPNARPMHPDWARSIRDQCVAAGVPFLFKQWGEHWPLDQWEHEPKRIVPDAMVNEPFYRVGKHAAARMLNGRTWDEFPEVRR